MVESSEEDEVYAIRPQPYTTNRKGAKGRQKQSESQKEEALRRKAEIQEQEEEVPMEAEEIIDPKPKRILKRHLPSVIDQLTPYDISEDLLSMRAQAMYGQLLQYPNQRRYLAKAMRRKKAPSTKVNLVKTDSPRKTYAMRCHVRIRGSPVVADLDSGAAVSLMTRKLMEKLGLEVDRPSGTTVITANRNRVRALGIVSG